MLDIYQCRELADAGFPQTPLTEEGKYWYPGARDWVLGNFSGPPLGGDKVGVVLHPTLDHLLTELSRATMGFYVQLIMWPNGGATVQVVRDAFDNKLEVLVDGDGMQPTPIEAVANTYVNLKREKNHGGEKSLP